LICTNQESHYLRASSGKVYTIEMLVEC